MRKLASVVLVTVCLAVGMVSCGDDDGIGVEVEETGTLEVVTTAVGDTLDADGYTLTLDGVPSGTVGVNDVRAFYDLEPGSHSVELGDVAVNCGVGASNPQTVTLDAGLTTHAVFPVGCRVALFDHIAFFRGGPGNN
ncbi:MAG: hypothetical protein JSV86_07740, partial [Gemmatimonadota bacterium]